jgi:hypothetical protein
MLRIFNTLGCHRTPSKHRVQNNKTEVLEYLVALNSSLELRELLFVEKKTKFFRREE